MDISLTLYIYNICSAHIVDSYNLVECDLFAKDQSECDLFAQDQSECDLFAKDQSECDLFAQDQSECDLFAQDQSECDLQCVVVDVVEGVSYCGVRVHLGPVCLEKPPPNLRIRALCVWNLGSYK